MFLTKHIPNFLTCCNLLCGCIGIIVIAPSTTAFQNELISSLKFASYLIYAAAIFDFFDGFAARLLNVKSDIGKELDSLADMVTFGVLPGMMLFKIAVTVADMNSYLPYLVLVVPVFSALRLAKFNIDIRQTESFIGLPTPANAIFISALPFIIESYPGWLWLQNPYTIAVLAVIMSLLLVAELPLFALKFKVFAWSENKVRYSFILMSLTLVALLGYLAIPAIIGLYLAISAWSFWAKKSV